MKIQENRKFFVLFYMLGFMAGILYANVLAGDYIASMGIFSDFFLNQYCQTEVHAGGHYWFLCGQSLYQIDTLYSPALSFYFTSSYKAV